MVLCPSIHVDKAEAFCEGGSHEMTMTSSKELMKAWSLYGGVPRLRHAFSGYFSIHIVGLMFSGTA
jgi:hypothetical protein